MVGRTVVAIVVAEIANERDFVHLPGGAREQVTYLNARNIGGGGTEVAAKLGRGVGLHVPGVDGAEAAVQEEKNERHVARRTSLLLSKSEAGEQARQPD